MARQERLRNLDHEIDRSSLTLLDGEWMVGRLQLDQGNQLSAQVDA
jgi:hypothetical protein